MSFVTVAKKEFQDSARSRWLWVVTVLFVLFAAGVTYYNTGITGSEDPSTVGLLFSMLFPATLFIPIIGLMVGYKAVVGERESGTLKLMLSLPHKRGDVVVGKFLGRSLSLTVGIVIGFAVAILVFVTQTTSFDVVAYLSFLLLSLLYGLVFVSIGVGISSLIATSSRAIGLAIFAYIMLVFPNLWAFIPTILRWVTNGFSLDLTTEPPGWAQFFSVLSANSGFSSASRALIDFESLSGVAQETPDEFYLQDWFGLVVLLAWLIIPLALCYVRFERADLS